MAQTLSTTDYTMFKLRNDNRVSIKPGHVERLKKSIAAKNLLYMAPISVNQDMEIINGQHRYLAAQELGVPLYYIIQKDFNPEDMICMNTQLIWTTGDVFNFYCKNRYPEYLKLEKKIKSTGVPIAIALRICIPKSSKSFTDFRSGKYVYDEDIFAGVSVGEMTIARIRKIRKILPSKFTESGRFWTALLKLVKHVDFQEEKWFHNLEVHMEKMTPKASVFSYLQNFVNIYNWRNSHKIFFTEEQPITE